MTGGAFRNTSGALAKSTKSIRQADIDPNGDGKITISGDELASLGIDGMAYIRQLPDGGGNGRLYAVYAADGTRLRLYGDRKTATRVIRENGLVPASLH